MQTERGPSGPFFSGQNESQVFTSQDYLNKYFYGQKPPYFEQLQFELSNFPKTDDGLKSSRLLTALLTSRSASSFKLSLDKLNIEPEKQGKFYDLPQVINIAKLISTDADRFKLQLGIMLPILTDQGINILDNDEELLHDNSHLRVSPNHKDWYLCYQAEERLCNSIENNSVIVVNDFLALKLEGRTAALATESVVTQSGHTFVKGNFYAPIEPESRKYLKNKFIEGKSKVFMPTGDWTIIRAVVSDSDIPERWLMREVSNYVNHPPKTLAERVSGLSRRAFINKRAETYPG